MSPQKPHVTVNRPFVPDLGGWAIADLMRLSHDPAFREQCYRKADPDSNMEDTLTGTAKLLFVGHGRRIAKIAGCRPSELRIAPSDYCEVAHFLDTGRITNVNAGLLLEAINAVDRTGFSLEELATGKSLLITGGNAEVDEAVEAVIAANPKPLQDYLAGKKIALGAVVGMVMKLRKGLDPKSVRERLEARLITLLGA